MAGLFLIIFSFSACRKHDTVFREKASSESGVDFNNKLTYSESLTVLDFEYMFNGAGVALAISITTGCRISYLRQYGPARLYLNKGNLKFEDITKRAG
jgi:hypothetical protein